MQDALRQKMNEMGYSDLTMYQKEKDLVRYFGDPQSFKHAYENLMRIEEVHKRANAANKINSILKLLPELKPDEKTYESFREKQKEYNQKRNKHYTNRDNSVVNDITGLLERCKEKENAWKESRGTPNELKCIREYMMCLLYILLPDYIGRSVEFRHLQLRKRGTSREQNYITPSKLVLGTYKLSAKKEIDGRITKLKSGILRIPIPKEVSYLIRRFRSLTQEPYVFGGNTMLSQSGYHFMQKRVLGYATNDLRKMMVQHREGMSKKRLQSISDKMGNTIGTLLRHYM